MPRTRLKRKQTGNGNGKLNGTTEHRISKGAMFTRGLGIIAGATSLGRRQEQWAEVESTMIFRSAAGKEATIPSMGAFFNFP